MTRPSLERPSIRRAQYSRLFEQLRDASRQELNSDRRPPIGCRTGPNWERWCSIQQSDRSVVHGMNANIGHLGRCACANRCVDQTDVARPGISSASSQFLRNRVIAHQGRTVSIQMPVPEWGVSLRPTPPTTPSPNRSACSQPVSRLTVAVGRVRCTL